MKLQHLRSQRGLTMLIVMLLMTAMLMGALAFARVTEVGTLVSNNVATKESSFHAAEVGRGAAFAALQALPTRDIDNGAWYRATEQPLDAATGIPTPFNFEATPRVPGNVGRFEVTYAVERLCRVAGPIDNSGVDCLTLAKTFDNPAENGDPRDMSTDEKDYMPQRALQYRITVRVTDVRNTQTWTQTLVTLN